MLHDEEAEQHVFLLIGDPGGRYQARLLPDSDGAKAFLRALPTDVFFWQEDRQAGRNVPGALLSLEGTQNEAMSVYFKGHPQTLTLEIHALILPSDVHIVRLNPKFGACWGVYVLFVS